jgi:hypothetical protein
MSRILNHEQNTKDVRSIAALSPTRSIEALVCHLFRDGTETGQRPSAGVEHMGQHPECVGGVPTVRHPGECLGPLPQLISPCTSSAPTASTRSLSPVKADAPTVAMPGFADIRRRPDHPADSGDATAATGPAHGRRCRDRCVGRCSRRVRETVETAKIRTPGAKTAH